MVAYSSLALTAGLTFLTSAHAASFDYDANDHLALYWGQNSAGSQGTLASYCAENDADIFILSFLDVFGLEAPQLNLANACTTTFNDSALLDCPDVGADIQTCQSQGKIVLLSMGGGAGYYGFENDSQAEAFATTLWDMFGGGSDSSVQRPFGDAIVDGFDFDIEASSPDATGYTVLAQSLKTLFSTGTKSYYLSAAPQCPYPDAYVGAALANASFDFAFIQFYNNYCSLTGTSFNFDTWETFAQDTSPNKDIKLLVGLPGGPSAAGSGYVSSASTLQSSLAAIVGDSNFGGVMLWDASQAYSTEISGTTYAHEVRTILDTITASSSSKRAVLEARDVDSSNATSSAPASHSHVASSSAAAASVSATGSAETSTVTQSSNAVAIYAPSLLAILGFCWLGFQF